MDMNTLVLAYVRDTLGLERDQVFITGSRAIPGASTPESDYDIVVSVTKETYPVIRSQLGRLGHMLPFVREKRRYEDGGHLVHHVLLRQIQHRRWHDQHPPEKGGSSRRGSMPRHD